MPNYQFFNTRSEVLTFVEQEVSASLERDIAENRDSDPDTAAELMAKLHDVKLAFGLLDDGADEGDE